MDALLNISSFLGYHDIKTLLKATKTRRADEIWRNLCLREKLTIISSEEPPCLVYKRNCQAYYILLLHGNNARSKDFYVCRNIQVVETCLRQEFGASDRVSIQQLFRVGMDMLLLTVFGHKVISVTPLYDFVKICVGNDHVTLSLKYLGGFGEYRPGHALPNSSPGQASEPPILNMTRNYTFFRIGPSCHYQLIIWCSPGFFADSSHGSELCPRSTTCLTCPAALFCDIMILPINVLVVNRSNLPALSLSGVPLSEIQEEFLRVVMPKTKNCDPSGATSDFDTYNPSTEVLLLSTQGKTAIKSSNSVTIPPFLLRSITSPVSTLVDGPNSPSERSG